jgi:hypothetical protein
MVFLDGNIRFGRGIHPARFDTADPDKALEMLDFLGIEKALVRLEIQEEWSPVEGNREVLDYCAHSDRLIPLWSLLPWRTGEFPRPHEISRSMKEAGVPALAALKGIQFPLEEPLYSGDILAAMEEESIPLLYPMAAEEELIILSRILTNHPRLTLIGSINKSAWGMDRLLLPLFERFSRFYFCPSGYHISGSLQKIIENHGAERLVFGSGYPYLNPGGALEFLKRLDIDGGDKRKIAGENLANLLNWGAYENN